MARYSATVRFRAEKSPYSACACAKRAASGGGGQGIVFLLAPDAFRGTLTRAGDPQADAGGAQALYGRARTAAAHRERRRGHGGCAADRL